MLWLEHKIFLLIELQRFSNQNFFSSRGHLVVSGEIFDCHISGKLLACRELRLGMQFNNLQSKGQPQYRELSSTLICGEVEKHYSKQVLLPTSMYMKHLGILFKCRFWFGRTSVTQRFFICNKLSDVAAVAGSVLWTTPWVQGLWSSVRVWCMYFRSFPLRTFFSTSGLM